MVNYYLTPIAVLDVHGNLLPTADDTYDLGSATKAWQDLFVEGDITLTDAGTISTGTGVLTLDSTDATIQFDAVLRSVSNAGPRMEDAAASATVPVFDFVNDPNTGIGRAAGDQLSLIAGGVEIMRMVEGDADYAYAPLGIRIGTDSADALLDDGTSGSASTTLYIGDETIDTTASHRGLKENIVSVNGSGRQHLEELSGLLSEYDYRNGVGHFVGLIAEDVQGVLPQYVVGSDQPSLRYHYMVGPLLWGWADHDQRIKQLEAQIAER